MQEENHFIYIVIISLSMILWYSKIKMARCREIYVFIYKFVVLFALMVKYMNS